VKHVDPSKPSVGAIPRVAATTFFLLFCMNLFDYIDRYIYASVLVRVEGEFRIDNETAGWGASVFLISYTLISPLMGYTSDRTRRTRLLGLGVGVWSLATVGTGLAGSFRHVLLARAFLGIGEATYGVIAPTLLMDLYARERRSRVMSAFYLAMPIGAALGLVLGAKIAELTGSWRAPFFLIGAPGFLVALSAFWIPEPVRGTSEGLETDRLRAHERSRPTAADYQDMLVNSSYTYSVFGMAAYTFAIGGLSIWMPKFLTATRGLSEVKANTYLGAATAVAAILGMTLGGKLADAMSRTNPKALFIVPGLAMLIAIPFMAVGLLSSSLIWIYGGIFMAEFFMFMNTGPCNAIIANVTLPNMRGVAYAVAVFAIHFLGDIWSPVLIGKVADLYGDSDAMRTTIGRMLASIGAVPTIPTGESHRPENMAAGLLITIPAVALSGIVLLAGARHIERETALMLARLKATTKNGGKETVIEGGVADLSPKTGPDTTI
jgi:MFS family permease